MGEPDLGALLREAVTVVLKLGGPPLLAALAIGLLISLVQAVTQINEQTVAFVPKLVAVVAVLVLFGPFMLTTLLDFMRLLIDRLIAVGSQ